MFARATSAASRIVAQSAAAPALTIAVWKPYPSITSTVSHGAAPTLKSVSPHVARYFGKTTREWGGRLERSGYGI